MKIYSIYVRLCDELWIIYENDCSIIMKPSSHVLSCAVSTQPITKHSAAMQKYLLYSIQRAVVVVVVAMAAAESRAVVRRVYHTLNEVSHQGT